MLDGKAREETYVDAVRYLSLSKAKFQAFRVLKRGSPSQTISPFLVGSPNETLAVIPFFLPIAFPIVCCSIQV